jgi:hypothetical protein
LDMGQNRRIEKKRESRGFGEEDRIGYRSNWENREKEGTEMGRLEGRQEWIWVKWENREKKGRRGFEGKTGKDMDQKGRIEKKEGTARV